MGKVIELFYRSKPLRVKPAIMTSARWLIHIIALGWLISVFVLGFQGKLPGDPVQYLTDFTGISAFNLLLLSLCISPLSEYLKFLQLIKLRKTFGVYAAFYALCHFAVFIVFELQFEWKLLLSEIIERPYITVGFAALLILFSLLATSTQNIQQKMGRSWAKLHRWVYVALVFICLHFIWSIKSEELAPYVYISFSVVLLYIRRNKLRRFFK